jgi:hypothetical protein
MTWLRLTMKPAGLRTQRAHEVLSRLKASPRSYAASSSAVVFLSHFPGFSRAFGVGISGVPLYDESLMHQSRSHSSVMLASLLIFKL